MIVFCSLYPAGNREDKRNVALSRLTERRFEKLGYFKQAILKLMILITTYDLT
jgi:hypothetical protein